jgi:hypothetical protein
VNQPGGYSEKQQAAMAHRFSRLKPVEAEDICCHCRKSCEEGFAIDNMTAYRINGHPLCARPGCYYARLAEFFGHRHLCSCGRNKSERLA